MNRFTIVEGFYVYLSLHGEGQFSAKYQRLCHMSRYFHPGAMWSETRSLEDPAIREVYDYLVANYKDK